MRCRVSPLALAAVLAAMPFGARADATASLRLSDFGYSLIDLDSDDGITPAVSFDARSFRASVSASAVEQFRDANGQPDSVSRTDSWNAHFTLFPEIGRSASLPGASSSSVLSGSVAEHSYGAVLEGRARNGRGDGLFRTEFRAEAEPANGSFRLIGIQALSLTPFTELVWTGQLDLDSQSARRLPGMRYEASGARAELGLFDAAGRLIDGFEAQTQSSSGSGPDTRQLDIRLSFANATDAVAHGHLASNLSVSGVTYLPIPEPGTPGLLLGGLGLLAWALRRRQPLRPALPLLAALAGALAGPAQAAISARVGVTNLGYTLIDLNPGDGIAPGLRLVSRPGRGGGVSNSISEYYLRDDRIAPFGASLDGRDMKLDSSGPFVPLATAISGPQVQASASQGGSVTARSLSVRTQGSFDYPVADAAHRRGSGFITWAETSVARFRLTPFTQMVWQGDYALGVDATVGRAHGTDEWVGASFGLGLADRQNRGVGGLSRNLRLFHETGSREDNGAIDVSIVNDAARPFVGSFSLWMRVAGQLQESFELGSAPPVPEAGTWALWLCGLGVVGAAARARRRAMPPGVPA
ncbi:PEP-CTERM sorting domain-containing protein [Azohydromonas caseinilytica]|uniref:PEP-CTERM sorting domain-containing protein n=1 Tax=Azohydromonas caseinilytica TaxID=2728836 RepID=A0A848FDY8_9BURK|nr:PEP-CTERM sorting domain-containing protein [Azohydromonas caseinilytica]NML16589.1 PEP-CTERM sorting domain-containing protein [Azohydromonas caseinilytica]